MSDNLVKVQFDFGEGFISRNVLSYTPSNFTRRFRKFRYIDKQTGIPKEEDIEIEPLISPMYLELTSDDFFLHPLLGRKIIATIRKNGKLMLSMPGIITEIKTETLHSVSVTVAPIPKEPKQ